MNKDTLGVHEFHRNGSMDSKGKINFYGIHNGTAISKIDMKQRQNGLWLTTNPALKPPMLPTGDTKTPKATTRRSIQSATIRY
jgi:hypothetical protein